MQESNERADRLANGAAPFGGLTLSAWDILFSLHQDAMERRLMGQSVSMNRLQAKGCEWGEGADSCLRGDSCRVATRLLMGSMAPNTLRKVLEMLEGREPGTHPKPFFSWC